MSILHTDPALSQAGNLCNMSCPPPSFSLLHTLKRETITSTDVSTVQLAGINSNQWQFHVFSSSSGYNNVVSFHFGSEVNQKVRGAGFERKVHRFKLYWLIFKSGEEVEKRTARQGKWITNIEFIKNDSNLQWKAGAGHLTLTFSSRAIHSPTINLTNQFGFYRYECEAL